ncbi:MAG: hypothetical protein G01um101448_293 [Parcubacteria group bacterium Gr01-1014_48]|nr:MAG: hypothetical protein Greene041614_611 [Parcubacteria group bacterium Greene0416_14]TSC74183.1 MAG: hypothetical protein G01um101448_293 [Parcubacteria group bacterium Gr01-1014_48]TSD00859.1 MAG: hypothetical protein Greene101415_660 [Parcubacteria group bacterium Greene1014_15]TSD07941.1 MAG: hypothetical protein Greene07144_571 [Parcubacteria group bacterium Greene0714_4]
MPRKEKNMARDRKAYEEDIVWIDNNWDELCKAYADQWIAVIDGKVIANAIELDDLLVQLDDPACTAVEFIEGKDTNGNRIDRY